MSDVADAARVSLATVDRVLNRRKGVKPRTIERVLKAAVELGYMQQEERDRLSGPRPPNVAFLLPKGANPYLRVLGDKVRAVAETGLRDEVPVRCFFIESFDAGAYFLRRLSDQRMVDCHERDAVGPFCVMP